MYYLGQVILEFGIKSDFSDLESFRHLIKVDKKTKRQIEKRLRAVLHMFFSIDEVSVQIEQFHLFTSVLQFCMSSRDHFEKFTEKFNQPVRLIN